jgi:AraC-like DNA-binding protein
MDDLGNISGPAICQYLVSAQARQVDTARGLELAGISAINIDQADTRIDGERFEVLLRWLIAQSADPVFGLHTSEYIQPGSYSVMGYIAMSAATILDGFTKMTQYEKLVGDMGTSDAEPLPGGRIAIHWRCRYPRQPVRRHLIENVFASWVRYVRWLTGDEKINPIEVWLEHSAPPSHQEAYEQIFRCPVRFNQPHSALVSDLATLSHPMRQPDPQLCATLEAHARAELSRLTETQTLSSRVRRHLKRSINQQLPRKEQAAEALGMNVRTLHRRLKEEGTSWQQLLNGLREEMALEYLESTDSSQTEIAQWLGYSDIRSFQRSFKRLHGMTPGEWRQRQAEKE